MNTDYSAIPPGVKGRDRWVCWRNVCKECWTPYNPKTKECPDCGEETAKMPVNAETGDFAKAGHPDTWTDFETAREFHEGDSQVTHGMGFFFHEDGQFTGVDFDDCRDPETEEIDEWAKEAITQLASYTEVSPSETGAHTLVYGELPEGGNRHDDIEMYDEGRYFTVTGDHIPRSPSDINYRQEEIEAIHEDKIKSQGYGTAGSEIVDFQLEDPPEGDDVTYTNDLGDSLEELRDRDDKLDRLLSHTDLAEYDSTSEVDMATVDKLWWWRFDPQDIAGILRTYRRRPKLVRRDDYVELTVGKAIGSEQYDRQPDDFSDVDIGILDTRDHYDSITEAELPDDDHFTIAKPPREGGSHASIDHLSDENLVVLVSRHSIADHHLGIFDKVLPENACAVHYAGRHRTCDHPEKERCPDLITDFEQLWDLEHDALDMVQERRTIAAEDCPDRYCAHQFLKHCEKHAHASVTVPQLISYLSRDLEDNNLLIDEEQALAHFRPDSTDLLKISVVYEPDGTRSVQVASSNIGSEWHTLESIREDVYEEYERREEEAEQEGRDWRRNPWEIDIENAIDYLEQVKATLGVTETAEEMESNGEKTTVKAVIDELRNRIGEIDRPEPHTDPDKFRAKLSEYTAPYYHDDETNPGAMIEAALYPYEDRPFDFKKVGPAYKLRMIGGRQIFHADLLEQFQQIGIIAGHEGELLFSDLDMDARVVSIDEFNYANSFAVVPVAKENDGVIERVQAQRRRARSVSKLLNHRHHPHLAVTGTKTRAQDHHSNLDTGLGDVIANPTSPAKDTYQAWTGGMTAIIYENSAVSRGVDAPSFDISVVASSGFATPYWEARKAHYYGEDEDEYRRAAAIEASLKAHELTNAVLRPSPTRNVEDHCGTKFIVCSEYDAQRLRYLQGRILPKFAYAEHATNFIQQLTIPGPQREEIDNVYDELGGDGREFTEVALAEGFSEVDYDKPSYDLSQLESWKENRYLTAEATIEKVEGLIDREQPITTPTVKENRPAWSNGRIDAALDVLEKESRIECSKTGRDSDKQGDWEWETT